MMSGPILYPSAETLDSGDRTGSTDWSCTLYLEPASDDSPARIHLHSGVGNKGTPEPARHNRWLTIGTYYGGTTGESVLAALQQIEDVLVLASDSYCGAQWNGHNHVGRWESDVVEDAQRAFDGLELRHYWRADDWYVPAGVDWTDLCREAGIDPERALGEDWEDAAREVAAVVEPLQDEIVRGTADYAIHVAEEYREEVGCG